MKLRELMFASLSLALVAVVAGCAGLKFSSPNGLHDTSRTGKVHDVKIVGNEITPQKIQVQPGDEIRWVNHRNKPVQIAFTDPLDQKLSCQRNFLGMRGMTHETKIDGNESASLCFLSPGTLNYTARLEADVPGNEIISSGSVEIGSGQSVHTSDRSTELSRF
jgi:plastocyanin